MPASADVRSDLGGRGVVTVVVEGRLLYSSSVANHMPDRYRQFCISHISLYLSISLLFFLSFSPTPLHFWVDNLRIKTELP